MAGKNFDNEQIIKYWTDFMKNMEGKVREIMSKGTVDISEFQKNWTTMSERITRNIQGFKPNDFMQFKNLFDSWMEFSNWIQNSLGPDRVKKEPVLKELLDVWMEHSQHIGSMLSDMLNDFMREQYEMFNMWMDSVMKGRPTTAEAEELTSIVGNHWQDLSQSMADLMKDQEAFTKDPVAQSRKAFDLWSSSFSKMTKDMMGSPGFLKFMGTTLNKAMDQQQAMSKAMEERLSTMRIPTKSDIEDIYQGLHELENRLDRQENLLKDIQKSVGSKSKK